VVPSEFVVGSSHEIVTEPVLMIGGLFESLPCETSVDLPKPQPEVIKSNAAIESRMVTF